MDVNAPAFTLIEMLAMILCIILVATLLLPSLGKKRQASMRLQCVNNLNEIARTYRLWTENGDRPPAETSLMGGGWEDCLTNTDQGALCWTNYFLMTNVMQGNTKMLVCPADQRRPASNFETDFKDNTHLSYFVGIGANDIYPQSIQSGDRNLGPGPEPTDDYGYSPTNGKGNDVTIAVRSQRNSVFWSLKMHSAGEVAGAGNILLGDGSAQQTTSASFRINWLSNAVGSWPYGHEPAVPSIRLVFP